MNSDCKQMQMMFSKFENKRLPDGQMKVFCSHLLSCEECREEMENYYIINYALNDEGYGGLKDKECERLLDEFDFSGMVDLRLSNEIKRQKKKKRICRAVIVGIIAVLTVIAVAIIIFFIFNE